MFPFLYLRASAHPYQNILSIYPTPEGWKAIYGSRRRSGHLAIRPHHRSFYYVPSCTVSIVVANLVALAFVQTYKRASFVVNIRCATV